MTTCFVCDIDGTIAEPVRTAGTGQKWETEIILNPPKVREPMRKLVQSLALQMPVIYATARREEIRTPTKSWLDGNGFPFGPLYMRTANVAQEVMKRRLLLLIREQGYKPVAWFDDDAAVVAMLRMEGVNALGCG